MRGFAYGDSVETGDDKYILAQFRHDAILTWVSELRSFLNLEELKWRDYRNRREYVQSNRTLSQKVHSGLEQAELTIIDLPMYRHIALSDLINQGAEAGHDYDLAFLNDLTARRMISESPLGRLSHLEYDLEYIPLAGDDPECILGPFFSDHSRSAFSTSEVHAKAGGKLSDAVILAARAHSILSPSETMEVVLAFGRGIYGPSNVASALEIVKSMGRAFDVEHEKSIPILNELVDKVARTARLPTFVVSRGRQQAISEEASQLTDHMQAADLAAGWAADLLLSTNGDYRALAKMFRWVGVNGVAIPG
jgi:hypothetical protein